MSIQPLDGQLSPTPLSVFAGIGDAGGSLSQAGAQGTLSGDAISRMVPPWLAGTVSNPAQTALFGPLPGLLQQLVQMLQQMMGLVRSRLLSLRRGRRVLPAVWR